MTDVTRRLVLAASFALAVASGGCSRDAQAQARKYVASGDAYLAKHLLNQSVIEYKRAVQAKPDWPEAHYKLAKAYDAQGDPVNAYREYAWAGDLDPTNADAQVHAGTLLLAAGEFQSARTRAELAVKAAPDNPAANILLGNALAGLNETDKAVKQIEQAISLDPSYAPAWTALGAVQFIGGTYERAGSAFRKAIELAPRSMDARLALANFEWASGDIAAAERTLQAALTIDPDSVGVHRALALLYLSTNRTNEAEPHFKALTPEPGGQLALADFYTGVGKRDAAMSVLRAVEAGKDKDAALAARLRIAGLEFVAGRKAEAHAILDDIIREKPRNEEARIAKARMLLVDGKTDEAAAQAQEAVKAAAGSPAAQYTLGLTAIARNDGAAAEEAFQNVLKLNPRAAAARLQLARLQLARGETAGALQAAEAVSRERPDDPEAAVLVSRSLRAPGDLPRAERELSARLSRKPDSAPLHLEMGWLAFQRKEAKTARQSFEEALRLQPTLHDARVGLVTLDIFEKRFDVARGRIGEWQEQAPADPRLTILSARIDLASGRTAEAEHTLRALVTADPSQLDAYDLLGRIAMSAGQLDRAVVEYQSLAERTKTPAGPLTLVGMIQEARGDREAARQRYEKVLAIDPHAGVAANNLAWMYAEAGRLDEALKLATIATEQLKRPEAEDTLGWVYYKKGLAQHAIAAFERAVAKAPENPVYQYHLGLAQLKDGNDTQGRAALKRALAIKSDFNGADEARKALLSEAR
jgi:tetratricopeptide (TPR) repeat protein